MRLRWVKVGLELFLAEGGSLVSRLRDAGYQVFLDLKLHDIPNTVTGAVRAVLPLEPALLTVHAAGGETMLRAAAEAAAGSVTRLLAVTVLTSLGEADLAAIGVNASSDVQVQRLARLAAAGGIDGMVCSPREVAHLRRLLPAAHLVTPGIRPTQAAGDDQSRTGTPTAALLAGSSQIVVGRPVTASADPGAALMAIFEEMQTAIGSQAKF